METKEIAKKVYAIKANDGSNRLTAKVYYSKGGVNVFTYRNEPRGYYFSLTPEKVKGNCVSYTAFSGSKTLMFEASRRTKKGEEKAANLLDSHIEKYMNTYCEENGFQFV